MESESSIKKLPSAKLDKASWWLILAGIFATPVLIWPAFGLSLEVAKKYFLLAVIAGALICWLLARFKDKKLSVAKSWSLAMLGIFLVLALVSALLSISVRTSLIGLGFESGTMLSLAIFSGLLFLASIYGRSKQKFLKIYMGLFVVFAIAFIFQLLRFAFGNFLPWSVFDFGAANLVGKWNDLGFFAGLVGLSSVVMLEFFPLKEARAMKTFVQVSLVLSVAVLALVNFSMVWTALAVLLFILIAYNFFYLAARNKGGSRLLKTASVVFIICLAFVIFGRPISLDSKGQTREGFLTSQVRRVSEKLNIASIEVRPSFSGTFLVARENFKQEPFFGAGPNMFSGVWLKNKPAGVNDSPYWNIEPAFGVGFVPTMFSTTGTLGGIALIVFVLLLVASGLKALFTREMEHMERAFLLLAFAGLVYSWIFMSAYVPETAMLAIIFALTGLFIARLSDTGLIKISEVPLFGGSKANINAYTFAGVSALVLGFIVYSIFAGGIALAQFQRGVNILQKTGDADKAEKMLKFATTLNPLDVYYRTASQVNLAQMSALLQQKLPQDQMLAAYAQIFDKAKANADKAVGANTVNHSNYAARGYLYENIMNLGVNGAYDLAKKDYTEAITYNVHGPDLYLNLARLEVANKDFTKAEKYLEQSLKEKKDYLDAIFLQSQIYAQRGFLDSAIKRADYAASIAPSNVGVLFQLGYLKYRNADYRGSIQALKQAVVLAPDYANAKYFLGLSYDKLGQTASAIKEFTDIQRSNPENTEVAQILANLKAGRNALVGTEPIEKKTEPPVDDE